MSILLVWYSLWISINTSGNSCQSGREHQNLHAMNLLFCFSSSWVCGMDIRHAPKCWRSLLSCRFRDPRTDHNTARVDGVLGFQAWYCSRSNRNNVHLWLAESGAYTAQLAGLGWKRLPAHLLCADREPKWPKQAWQIVGFVIYLHKVPHYLHISGFQIWPNSSLNN